MASLHKTKAIKNGKEVTYPRWRGSYKNEHGKWVKVSLYRDKAASQKQLNRLQELADQRRAGVLTTAMEHAMEPTRQQLQAYLADLRGQNRNPAHIRNAETRLSEAITLGKWQYLRDITAESMAGVLHLLSKRRVTRSKDKALLLSVSTVNSFLKYTRAFIRWLLEHDRLAQNPLRALKPANEARATKRRARRALTLTEISALLKAAPARRAFLYKFIMLTGLRRKEARYLLVGDLHLDASQAYIQLRTQQTKNGKADQIPLHPDLVEELKKLVSGRKAGDNVFCAIPEVRTLERDLEAAGIKFVDGLGRRADLHAQRHTYGTLLGLHGVPLMVAKELMRHQDPRLTANVYTHIELSNKAEALAGIKLPMTGEPANDSWKHIGKTADSSRPAESAPVASDEVGIECDDAAASADFTMKYGRLVVSRRVLSLVGLLLQHDADNVEKQGPRSSVG